MRLDEGRPIDLPCLDFGAAQLALLPAEAFVQYQLWAQQLSPSSFVMALGYGECAPGYIPSGQGRGRRLRRPLQLGRIPGVRGGDSRRSGASIADLGARVRSRAGRARGSCVCSARSNEGGDAGHLPRGATKPTRTTPSRPEGCGGAERSASLSLDRDGPASTPRDASHLAPRRAQHGPRDFGHGLLAWSSRHLTARVAQ